MEEEGIHFKMNNDVDVRQLPEVLMLLHLYRNSDRA